MDYDFQTVQHGKVTKIPDMSLIVGGALVFRSELKDKIFPRPCKTLEFLPIRVAGEKWLVMNCLTATLGYDRDESSVYRNFEEKIFLVSHLAVRDAVLESREIFVIDDSNRATLFVFPAFAERIVRLGLGGIVFKESGIFTK